MAKVGQVIEQPLSGERLTFLETAATTSGDLLKVRLEMAPGGALAKSHVHPRATEEFEVLSGRIQITTSGKTRIADAGEVITVPFGAEHVWGNPFDDPAAVAIAFSPALRMETFFENTFGLVRDGKCDPKTQMPSLLQMLLVMHEYREEITLPGVAGATARAAGAVLAPLARARGYRSRYPQYSDPDSP